MYLSFFYWMDGALRTTHSSNLCARVAGDCMGKLGRCFSRLGGAGR